MPTDSRYGVLVVDDDFRVAALHCAIVAAVHGFTVVASVGSVSAAKEALREHPEIELVLLDVHLPDGSGIDLIGQLDRDCFIVGAETDARAVRTAMRAGALAYLIKPFADAELARRLAGYVQYRRVLGERDIDQTAVDSALAAMRFSNRAPVRSAASSPTERRILALFDTAKVLFADDVSERIGISAATARRHLAAMVAAGTLSMSLQYGGTGRPRQEYRIARRR